ncbi:MAG: carbohydrate porin [Bacteroidetes bacterium]|nr:carbohydrate porin [Bacteroidota bacterium]
MRYCLLCIFLFITSAAFAQHQAKDDTSMQIEVNCEQQWFNAHFQTTYVYQYKPAFTSPYSGVNSLNGSEDHENSLTATLYLGAHLWKGAEVYVNPELAGGSGLSGALGMAGSSNGETFRVGNPAPTLYLARGLLKQTFALGRGKECPGDDANQLAGLQPKDYLRFYLGKYSIGDLFDNNEYSNSPREQFLNWSLMNNGAWDYAANVRGYTYAFTAELQMRSMNYKVAVATLPTTANGSELNTDITQAMAINAEVSREFHIRNKPGHIRLLGFYNKANMGNYVLSTGSAAVSDTPDVTATRVYSRTKTGFGINLDQQLNSLLGIFARIGWNDGKNETWCFTEIDQTASLGLNFDGHKWKRDEDNGGIAIVVNGLSKDHRNYLAAGGNGFILGDGKLNYAPEAIGELYYSFKPLKTGIWLTGDYQFCLNPGCNSDRGPVHIFSVRLHVAI